MWLPSSISLLFESRRVKHSGHRHQLPLHRRWCLRTHRTQEEEERAVKEVGEQLTLQQEEEEVLRVRVEKEQRSLWEE